MFLCGKCKRRFVTINQFMSHKQSQCVMPTNVHVPHGHPMMQQHNRGHSYGNLGHSPHMQVSSEVVLGDQGVPISNYTNMDQYQNTVLQRPAMAMPAGPFLAPHSQMGIGKEFFFYFYFFLQSPVFVFTIYVVSWLSQLFLDF